MNRGRYIQYLKLLAGLFRQFLMNPLLLVQATATDFFRILNNRYYAQYLKKLPNVDPLNIFVDPRLFNRPTLNVLIPGMTMKHMSGGPNTAINLAYRLAEKGIPIRFISTHVSVEKNQDMLWKHFSTLTGIAERLTNVEICCGADRSKPIKIGENDVFLGTAWWTVQLIKNALVLTKPQKFIYLIQEFEPGLYEFSSRYALALETYHMNFFGIINEQFLADYLCDNKIGSFSDPEFIKSCAVFEPALDTSKFYPVLTNFQSRHRRLLFYARPNAPRNLFELGLNALQNAALQGVFSGETWELLFIGESLPAMKLGNNLVIRSTPWLNYDAYADLVRSSDIALSLMLSPHTSYPPLEMAASGGIAVTCSFAGKTQQKLRQLSPNIIAVSPTAEGIVGGLQEAVRRVGTGQRALEQIHMPSSWDEGFSGVVPRLIEMFCDCQKSGD